MTPTAKTDEIAAFTAGLDTRAIHLTFVNLQRCRRAGKTIRRKRVPLSPSERQRTITGAYYMAIPLSLIALARMQFRQQS